MRRHRAAPGGSLPHLSLGLVHTWPIARNNDSTESCRVIRPAACLLPSVIRKTGNDGCPLLAYRRRSFQRRSYG